MCKGYKTAYAGLLDKALALAAAIEAWDHARQRAKVQEKRQFSRSKRATDEAKLRSSRLSLALSDRYLWSLSWLVDRWAREQEDEPLSPADSAYRPSGRAMLLHYSAWLGSKPSHTVMLIRYLTWLLWQTMDRFPSYRALALGCLLYSYAPQEVADFTWGALEDDNFRRIKGTLLDEAQQRFSSLTTGPSPPSQQERIIGRAPTCPQKQLIKTTLQQFVSWRALTAQPPHPVPSGQISALFDARRNIPAPDAREALAEQRNHALACPDCGGIPQLVTDWTL